MNDLLHTAHKNWGWFLAAGIALIILGFLAIGSAVYTTVFTVAFLGALLFGAGIIEVIYAFWAVKWSGFFLSIITGLLYLLTGALILWHPLAAATSLTLLMGILFTISGAAKILGSVIHRFKDWGWVLFSGLTSLILGFLILSDWPVSGLWVIGLFVGIDLIIYGWAWVILGMGAKRLPEA